MNFPSLAPKAFVDDVKSGPNGLYPHRAPTAVGATRAIWSLDCRVS
jgi:hypothetical protein